jgi:hypothetical protein
MTPVLDSPTNAKTLRERILKDLNDQIGILRLRKENTFVDTDEGIRQCLAELSMFTEAVRLIEQSNYGETVDKFRHDLLAVLEKNGFGMDGGWSQTVSLAAQKAVIRRIIGFLVQD